MQLDQLHRIHENPACALFEYRGSVMVTGLLHKWKGRVLYGSSTWFALADDVMLPPPDRF